MAYYWSEGDDSDLKLFENELSVFIDESGDFGETRDIRDYYLSLLFFMTKRMSTLTEKRNRRIKDQLHKISRHIADYARD
ncbi:hypothetical protein, partial [Butyrivibrio sp. AE3009]|uniref:hypothetical protein n=1 Tax=Butyrivibrio sp. AE3009 TaxID=1280666 RepID=UPI00047DCC1E